MARRKGIMLIVLVMLVVVVALLTLTTATFTAQSLKHSVIRAWKHQALMAAQGGVMRAAYEALQNSSYATTEAALAGTQNYKYSFSGGGGGGSSGSDFVYINASATSLSNANRRINNWTIINSSPSISYQITHMQMSWTGPGTRTLQSIYLGNLSTAKWTGSASTGTTIDIVPDFNLPAAATVTNNQLRFNNSMNSFTVNMTLYLNDGSTVSGQVWPAVAPTPPAPGGAPGILKATGRIEEGGGAVRMRQTILASVEVSGGAFKIIRYDETVEHLIP